MKLKHFRRSEFRCDCGCETEGMNDEFLLMLDVAREIAGVPFVVTSGYRCPSHNEAIGGVPDSSHVLGKAADIYCINSEFRFRILEGLIEVGFNRIGIDKTFIHADSDTSKIQRVAWLY